MASSGMLRVTLPRRVSDAGRCNVRSFSGHYKAGARFLLGHPPSITWPSHRFENSSDARRQLRAAWRMRLLRAQYHQKHCVIYGVEERPWHQRKGIVVSNAAYARP